MAFREGNPLILDKKEKTRRKKRNFSFILFCGTVKRFARKFVPLFKATQPLVSPFLLPRWRRIFMNIKQGKTREVLFPFPQNVLLRTVHPCQKKKRRENWLISNYISRKKRRGTRNLSFSLSSGLPIFSFFFLHGESPHPLHFPLQTGMLSPLSLDFGEPFLLPPPSGTNKHNTTTGRGREFSCEPTHPTPCQQPLLCHISLGRFPSFPFSQEVGEGERKAMTCEGKVLGKEGRRKKCGA